MLQNEPDSYRVAISVQGLKKSFKNVDVLEGGYGNIIDPDSCRDRPDVFFAHSH